MVMVFELISGLLKGAYDFENVNCMENGDAGLEGDSIGIVELL